MLSSSDNIDCDISFRLKREILKSADIL